MHEGEKTHTYDDIRRPVCCVCNIRLSICIYIDIIRTFHAKYGSSRIRHVHYIPSDVINKYFNPDRKDSFHGMRMILGAFVLNN